MATTVTTPPRTYVVKYDGFGSLDVFQLKFTVEIYATDEQLHEVNNFWCSSSRRLAESKGDIAETVMRMMAIPVMMKCQGGRHYLSCVNEIFKEEGWCSDWFKITDVDFHDMTSSEDFIIDKINNQTISPN